MTIPLLEIRQLYKSYQKAQGIFRRQTIQALSNVSFSLHTGQTLAIVGETGSGKSTLAKLLVGIETPDSGEILLEGKAVSISDHKKYNHVIRYIFQDPARSLNPHQRIGQMLDDVLRFSTALNESQREQKIHQTLAQLGLMEEHAAYYPHMFSGGQLQRVALARALIMDPKLLILDEALTALDPSLRAQIVNLLLELQQSTGLSYLLITNHLRLVRHISDTILVLHQGKSLDYGSTTEVFDNPQHDYSRKLISSAQS
ncbi:ATP-binding cassette domain-containing protein [Rheinheimera sediminis]|uniref:ATP-binding cassette domain-containing protein n=1 Tax=Rheinheimera sp. YQF-1 TaxID=2499626 RepID=UPI000FDBBB0A|nr:ATP-binding cassette domain-containing protein [Rheinheimera sp. YQF-1]RVT45819.1 ATP-binding cassette domain-containing protein [Rheinheimera sp. YQF-1]